MQNNSVDPSNPNWPNNQITQIPQTGANMQASPYGLYQVQEGNDTIVIRKERIGKHSRLVKYKLVTGGNAGPLLVSVENPKTGMDDKERRGEVCPTCSKGILLIDMDCVREKSSCSQALLKENKIPIYMLCFCSFCTGPFFCYLLFCKKRLCTSCNAEFPVSCL